MTRLIPLFRIKICGITRTEDARVAVEAGADAIGLNFYPKSTRFVNKSQAKEIVNEVNDYPKSASLRSGPSVVGVFVNASADEICETIVQVGLDTVQLHGDESPAILEEIKSKLALLGNSGGRKVSFLRALRLELASFDDFALFSSLIELWGRAGCGSVLLDSFVEGSFGGSGKTLDWERLRSLPDNVPLILAGGLTPENIADAIRLSGLKGVDVASGVERLPGIKDSEKVRQFARNCQW